MRSGPRKGNSPSFADSKPFNSTQEGSGGQWQDLVEQARLLRTDNLNLKTVIPHHWRLQPPPGSHTPEDVAAAFKTSGMPVTVIKPEFKKIYELTK